MSKLRLIFSVFFITKLVMVQKQLRDRFRGQTGGDEMSALLITDKSLEDEV